MERQRDFRKKVLQISHAEDCEEESRKEQPAPFCAAQFSKWFRTAL